MKNSFVILALLSATQAINYRPYGPPKQVEVPIEYETDDEKADIEQSLMSLKQAENEEGHKLNAHGLSPRKMTGSEAFLQLNDDANANGGPIDVRIKVISDDDDNKEGGSKFEKEQTKKDNDVTMRALERKQERIEKGQEERKLNDLQKKKAKEAIKLIDQFEQKQRQEDREKRADAEEESRNKRVEEVKKRGEDVLGNARDSANTAEKSSHDAIEAAASAKVTSSKARDFADDMKDKAAEVVTAAKEAEEEKEAQTKALENMKAESERITASLNKENFEKAGKKYYKGVLHKQDEEKREQEELKEKEDEKREIEMSKIEGMRGKIEKEYNQDQAKKAAAAAHEEQDKIEARRIKELRDWQIEAKKKINEGGAGCAMNTAQQAGKAPLAKSLAEINC